MLDRVGYWCIFYNLQLNTLNLGGRENMFTKEGCVLISVVLCRGWFWRSLDIGGWDNWDWGSFHGPYQEVGNHSTWVFPGYLAHFTQFSAQKATSSSPVSHRNVHVVLYISSIALTANPDSSGLLFSFLYYCWQYYRSPSFPSLLSPSTHHPPCPRPSPYYYLSMDYA